MTIQTGDTRVDKHQAALQYIYGNGWTVNAHQTTDGGFHIGWTDPSTKTVWLWPDKLEGQVQFNNQLLKVILHEGGHVRWHAGKMDHSRWSTARKILRGTLSDNEWHRRVNEDYAETVAYARMTQSQRNTIGWNSFYGRNPPTIKSQQLATGGT